MSYVTNPGNSWFIAPASRYNFRFNQTTINSLSLSLKSLQQVLSCPNIIRLHESPPMRFWLGNFDAEIHIGNSSAAQLSYSLEKQQQSSEDHFVKRFYFMVEDIQQSLVWFKTDAWLAKNRNKPATVYLPTFSSFLQLDLPSVETKCFF